ncbi:MAG TPA: CvpA family protein [Anaeromyxobacteraceae bacterium]|nr:CvpA family protein [Anaeromyxobacteraceae bacterium]
MVVDLAAVTFIALAAAFGSSAGALHQLVQLAGAVVGWLAAWNLGPPVARGLARWVPPARASLGAGLLLFLGFAILAAWVGHRLLATRGLERAVRSPPDRGLGALLGGAKWALVVWMALSALALAGGRVALGRFAVDGEGSDLLAAAREHNLLVRWRPAADEALKRLGSGGPATPRAPVPKPPHHAR